MRTASWSDADLEMHDLQHAVKRGGAAGEGGQVAQHGHAAAHHHVRPPRFSSARSGSPAPLVASETMQSRSGLSPCTPALGAWPAGAAEPAMTSTVRSSKASEPQQAGLRQALAHGGGLRAEQVDDVPRPSAWRRPGARRGRWVACHAQLREALHELQRPGSSSARVNALRRRTRAARPRCHRRAADVLGVLRAGLLRCSKGPPCTPSTCAPGRSSASQAGERQRGAKLLSGR